MLRLLFITGYYNPANIYGGPTQSTAALCAGLQRAGAQVTVLTTNANGRALLSVPLGRPVDVDGVSVYYYPLTLGGLKNFYSTGLVQALKAKAPENDLLVSQILWGYAGRVVRAVCSVNQIPYVIQLHGQLQPWALAQRAAKKRLYLALWGRSNINQAAALHCTDAGEAKAIQALGFSPPVFIVPHGIDMQPFQSLPGKDHYRRQFGIPEHANLLLFLGRLDPIKRPDIPIRVCAALKQARGVPAYLLLVGPGTPDQIQSLRELAGDLGITELVHFTGLLSREQVLEVLSAADLLLMPTAVQENFGMAALEALAAGVPVLTSEGIPVGRWAEQADAGRTAPCDAQVFTRLAGELLSDQQALLRMSACGRQFVADKFEIGRIAEEMLGQLSTIQAQYRGHLDL